MAMKRSVPSDDLFSLESLSADPGYASSVLAALPGIGDADSPVTAISGFRQALRLIGVDAGVFQSVIRDEIGRASHRAILACDPLWAIEYTRRNWHDRDPWIRHAQRSSEPVRSSELEVLPCEEDFVRTSSGFGFASALIAPAPSCVGPACIGVLSLGSQNPGFFETSASRLMRIIGRALAMELHRWLLHFVRQEMVDRLHIRTSDIELLKQLVAGHSSKSAARELHVDPRAVDGRCQRLLSKLNVPDRKSAIEVARLYGLV